MDQTPTIGRVVHYTLTDYDVTYLQALNSDESLGNTRVGQVVPAVIVAVWSPTLVNLHVLLDAPLAYWATSRALADEEHTAGRWRWPERT